MEQKLTTNEAKQPNQPTISNWLMSGYTTTILE